MMEAAKRSIARVVTTPDPTPGFMGEGHTAVMVVDPNEFSMNDPFIVLMDDRIDLKPGSEAGGAHPHAGFETVTFLVEGEVHDRDEGVQKAGDVLWMTAGSGVIHNEHVTPVGRTRILQLWLTLPSSDRWTSPGFENISLSSIPVRREPGVELRLYSGSSGGVRASTRNHVPVTLAEIRLDANARVEQELPGSYNGFVYVLEGSVRVGESEPALVSGQVGWLDRPVDVRQSVLELRAGDGGARVMLYAGEPQNTPVVLHGPFVGETRADIMRVSKDYMEGRFPRMSELTARASDPAR